MYLIFVFLHLYPTVQITIHYQYIFLINVLDKPIVDVTDCILFNLTCVGIIFMLYLKIPLPEENKMGLHSILHFILDIVIMEKSEENSC